MKIRGSRILVECLLKEKVDTLFCYTGGSVISIFDDLYRYGQGIRCIQPRHEQGGTHAADAYARSTGKVGVVLVTSGPGAINTVTGIATAHIDSVPLVVITGQVSRAKLGTGAFQEADMTGITRPLTKANFLVKNVEELAITVKRAFHIARSGRPGPVLIDIPGDVQVEETRFRYPDEHGLAEMERVGLPEPAKIQRAVEMINSARRPLVLAGGGVNFSGCVNLLNRFLDKNRIPVVTTLMGHGVNPSDETLYYGGLGMHGSLYGNHAVQNADLLIALGVRFSDRILGEAANFAPNAEIIHVDIDPAEIGKNIGVTLPIVANVRHTLEALISADIKSNRAEWLAELSDFKQKNPLRYSQKGKLKAQAVVRMINRYFPEDTIVATDVGQNQMWVAQYYRFRRPRSLISSSGLGTMGFGLPAAIGAKIGNPDRPVLMVAGDGGFQMNIQELATIKKYKLNLKMVVLDNQYLGMVRQWQDLLCRKRYAGTVMEDNPEFTRVVEAFDIKARKVTRKSELEEAVKQLAQSEESMLLHVVVDRQENVLPMVPVGNSLDNSLTKL